MDFAELDSRALTVCEAVVAQVTPAQYELATPCSAWNLEQLLAHMIGQNHGFAEAALGERTDRSVFDPIPPGTDPGAVFAASADEIRSAFKGGSEREFLLPEVRPYPIPGELAMSFHLVDSVVHAWDVAAALGVPVTFDDDLLDAAVQVAENVPDGDNRDRVGASFQHRLAKPGDGSGLAHVLALLGRTPGWPAAR
jgi:uncharacterized protein (TIGR03086 family)